MSDPIAIGVAVLATVVLSVVFVWLFLITVVAPDGCFAILGFGLGPCPTA